MSCLFSSLDLTDIKYYFKSKERNESLPLHADDADTALVYICQTARQDISKNNIQRLGIM